MNHEGLLDFGLMINSMNDCGFASNMKFSKYGSYCGRGGEGIPINTLDQCCCYHDLCYGNLDLCEHDGVEVSLNYRCSFVVQFLVQSNRG